MDLIGIGQELRKVAPCNGCSDASLTLDALATGNKGIGYCILCLNRLFL